jgi:hypothetical protein
MSHAELRDAMESGVEISYDLRDFLDGFMLTI